MQDLLGPLQKRIIDNSSVINRLKNSQVEDEKKINEIILMIENDPKVFEIGIFASVDEKFSHQTKKIEALSRQIDQANNYVDEKFKIVDIRIQ